MSLKPSVCIDAVFQGTELTAACERVAQCGYKAIEFWAWWEKDLELLISQCAENDLTIAACCTKFFSLVDPSTLKDYLTGLEASIAAAKDIGCTTLISQVGDFRSGISREEQHQQMINGLREAASILAGTGITLAIEPLNDRRDHPGYYLVNSDEAFAIIDAVASENIKVTFDLYHQQISEGDLLTHLLPNIAKVGHLHAAGNPGRNELDSGEMNYPQIIRAISQTDYNGFMGLEYWPLQAPEIGLRTYLDWFSSEV